MKKNQLVSNALFSSEVRWRCWQVQHGRRMRQEKNREPDRNLTRPGENENVPGMHGQGNIQVSKNDMRMVEEALKAKGYSPGKIDGVVDDANRAAIRSFPKRQESSNHWNNRQAHGG